MYNLISLIFFLKKKGYIFLHMSCAVVELLYTPVLNFFRW